MRVQPSIIYMHYQMQLSLYPVKEATVFTHFQMKESVGQDGNPGLSDFKAWDTVLR